ncbi:MAG: hypothetical protein RMJ59_07785 [Candidatus Nitrosocaldus sp.]|nr:hypothetical protein [Candidatus Nitrosocaldus sp.]MCS7141668.1 hypothetical protein [Candidatus Nitrosocaldus sp.]MDW8000687.1 hypothetical protein [Candidatus Nitrosocaldus sp.]MDW8276260.1 hypothetical protein [Candidatus Nitrosocaldus sp.]
MMKRARVTQDGDMNDEARRRMMMVWNALQGALSILGESSMQAVVHHLVRRGISMNNVDLKELEHVLYSLFGDGASVIMREIYKRLDEEERIEQDASVKSAIRLNR